MKKLASVSALSLALLSSCLTAAFAGGRNEALLSAIEAPINTGAYRAMDTETLLANIENYQRSAAAQGLKSHNGPYENTIRKQLAAINSIWALGESGDAGVMDRLVKFYAQADDVMKINILESIGKLKHGAAGPFVRGVAADTRENGAVRAEAFEILVKLGQPASVPGLAASKSDGIERADVIYTGGRLGRIMDKVSNDLPVSHAGLFAGTEMRDDRIYIVIAEVQGEYKPAGARIIRSWDQFLEGYPYFGNRTTNPGPTAAQREKIMTRAIQMTKEDLSYSVTHVYQKGPKTFDCIGYVEYLYEYAGLNITDDSYETGLGWPLASWEQFISLVPNTPRRVPYSVRTAAAPAAALKMLEYGLFGVLPDGAGPPPVPQPRP